MSTTTTTPNPIDQQQQQLPPPSPEAVTQQAYTAHSGHGSVGPVIAVLAVITILGVIAGMIGRLCSGRRIMGHGQYDFESWVETKCSSCLDGRVGPPPPPRQPPPDISDQPLPVRTLKRLRKKKKLIMKINNMDINMVNLHKGYSIFLSLSLSV